MARPRLAWCCALGLLAGAGCFGNRHDVFPLDVGFQPLEASTAPLPAGTASDPAPEGLTGENLRSGEAEPSGIFYWASAVRTGTPQFATNQHFFAHARVYVHAPLAATWAAMQDPEVCKYPIGKVDSAEVRPADPGEEVFPVHFKIHYTAGRFGVTVDWDISWRGGLLEGTPDAPVAYGLRSQKTDGFDQIEVQTSSMVARAVDAGTTEVDMVAWLRAPLSDVHTSEGTLEDFYAALLRKVHGTP